MTKEQLNSLVISYKLRPTEDSFRAIYDEYEPKWSRSVYGDAKRTCTDQSTMFALYDDALMKAIDKWDSSLGDFANYLARWINRARSNLQRTSLRRLKREQSIIERKSDEEDTPISELDRIDNGYRVEDHVYERMHTKKEAEKLSLLDSILEPTKVQNDSAMTVIIKEFPRYKTVNALAKALGLQRNTVDRKLRSLSRQFDANRFGDIEDYLAV
ncbi:hypothetical protein LOZ80_15210 [Paenibacillus sp. HWE-109]|uniref:hypothetical protein n=1 Tax=Paenibacillus sp. HWE-109 TaxID=1306526 RepID=UPI001EE0571C|nr:hypothetical protein [Paenibacillus sp. HWE-109]UKS30209.1 hypothetical protein LOZ80_15210 [Paenibacillus sp. HWE-109]